MFIEILFAIVIGCLLGVVTGLTPGLHINIVAAIILGFMPFLQQHFSVYAVAVLIVAMSVTHTFTDFIPSIFLGAASEDTAFAALPGSELLLKGIGLDAVRLTVAGGLLSLIAVVLLSPVLILAVPFVFHSVEKYVGWVLLFFSAALVFWQRSLCAVFWSAVVFSMSGLLGLLAFGISGLSEPLMPMLSGLFGVSLLLANVSRRVYVPFQHTAEVIGIRFRELLRPVSLGALSGAAVSIFPALGPAHSAVISTKLFGRGDNNSYLVLLGCINTVSMLMSLFTLYAFGKARNGSIVAVGSILKGVRFESFLLLIAAALVAGCFAVFLTLIIGRLFSRAVNSIDYRRVCTAVIALIVVLVAAFSGIIGLAVLVTATAIGIIPQLKKVSRSNAMGCLIVPVVAYYVL